MSATAFMLVFAGIAGPWLVALMRRHSWDGDLVTVVAVLFSFLCFIAGQIGDGLLTWPLPPNFWLGLAAAYGLNQSGYFVSKKVAPDALRKVEQV